MGRAFMNLTPCLRWNLGRPLGQARALLLSTEGSSQPDAILVAHSAVFDVDPFIEMFFFPEDTLHFSLLGLDGSVRWTLDLGRGAVPGMWFSPVFAMDLDGDGRDSIYTVLSADPKHPLSQNRRILRKISVRDGSTLAEYPWIHRQRVDLGAQWMGMLFRDFVFGGKVRGQPVLVTGQGTYGDMLLRAFDPGMHLRWERFIASGEPGARGSHMCPVLDWDSDGSDELLWGERLIALDRGNEIWCADREVYRGHSDIIQPVRMANGEFRLFTAREGDPAARPRVVCFDAHGQRLFGGVETGHMDMGWAARLPPWEAPVGMAVRIGHKSCGPDGRFHEDPEVFAWNLETGDPVDLPFPAYGCIPVDLNGDGFHELVFGIPGRDGTVLDGLGRPQGRLQGTTILVGHIGLWPGEQVLQFQPDGTLELWRDAAAVDSPASRARCSHPAYASLLRLTATGSNLSAMAGI